MNLLQNPELLGMVGLAIVLVLREVQHRRGQQSTPVLDLIQTLLTSYAAKQAAAASMEQIASAAADNDDLREVLARTLTAKSAPSP